MKNIIFIAPPAAGKGTQSDLLVKKYGYIHISTGDLLRNEAAKQTDLGNKIAELQKCGQFVPDDIVTELLKKYLIEIGDTNFILDGYPRNIKQAETLKNIMEELNRKIEVALYLEMDIDIALKRALGRIICPKCKRSYNKYEEDLKPKVDNICDDCLIPLEERSDDNESSFKTRFASYVNMTSPLLQYYRDINILKKIDNSGTPEETFKQIEEVIE